jgi:hypothetical protein
VSAALLVFFSVGFPLTVMRRMHRNPQRLHTDERFQERFDFFYEFYAPCGTSQRFWITDFFAACVVASGKSFLYPHSIYQIFVSVAIFGHKVLYIMIRRPYIDGMTDVIQGVLAVVSLVAVNMNFFERRGITDKIPSFNVGMAAGMICIFGLAILVTLVTIVLLLVRVKPEGELSPHALAYKASLEANEAAEAGAAEVTDGADLVGGDAFKDLIVKDEADLGLPGERAAAVVQGEAGIFSDVLGYVRGTFNSFFGVAAAASGSEHVEADEDPQAPSAADPAAAENGKPTSYAWSSIWASFSKMIGFTQRESQQEPGVDEQQPPLESDQPPPGLDSSADVPAPPPPEPICYCTTCTVYIKRVKEKKKKKAFKSDVWLDRGRAVAGRSGGRDPAQPPRAREISLPIDDRP